MLKNQLYRLVDGKPKPVKTVKDGESFSLTQEGYIVKEEKDSQDFQVIRSSNEAASLELDNKNSKYLFQIDLKEPSFQHENKPVAFLFEKSEMHIIEDLKLDRNPGLGGNLSDIETIKPLFKHASDSDLEKSKFKYQQPTPWEKP